MNDCSVAEKTVKILSDNDLRIAVAESLTGGMVAAEFVDVPGVSKVFIEGIVAYANDAKISRLGVKKETLEKFGAVSEETAREMAEGLIKNGVNVSLSTTGIAGPSGGSAAKPVGTVCFGFRVNGITCTKKQFFNGNRQEIRKKSTDFALNALYLLLLDDIDAFNAL